MSESKERLVQYTWLGKSGLEISNLCLGTMTFGKAKAMLPDYKNMLDADQAEALMDRFVEAGGNFMDTANAYSQGSSEEMIGDWMTKRQNRDTVVVATKVRFPRLHSFLGSTPPGVQGLSRRHIVQELEGSLKRLQTDYIDLYQTHMWDSATPLEETLRTMDDLVRCGKVRYVGASNLTGWQMQKAVGLCDKWGYCPYVSLQQEYNLMCRYSEVESFRVCENEGLGVLPWSPLKGGLLSGKFKRGMTVEEVQSTDSRIGFTAKNDKVPALEVFPKWQVLQKDEWTLNLLDKLHAVAAETGRTAAQVSLRWLLQKKVVSSVIIGATKMSQLDANLGAASDSWSLSAEQMKTLDEASTKPKTYPYSMVDPLNALRVNPHL